MNMGATDAHDPPLGPDDHAAAEAAFSDLHDGALPAERASAVETHLAACARCRAEYAHYRATVGALSALGRAAAPARFDRKVEETIHRRSAGRFFGRRAIGDRVPFEAIAIVALLAVIAAYWLLR
jgi:anti-sigma factor RsiW